MTVFTFARKLLDILNKGKDMRIFIYLFILMSSSLYAGEILKWVDEDGNIYYGDSPPLSVQTEQVRVTSAPSNPGKALPRLSDGKTQGDDNADGTNVSGVDDQGAPKLPEDQAKIACKEATDDLRVIGRSNRIRLKSADGTTRYMTIEEINARRESAEKAVALHCQ
jgi:hypothetical protein